MTIRSVATVEVPRPARHLRAAGDEELSAVDAVGRSGGTDGRRLNGAPGDACVAPYEGYLIMPVERCVRSTMISPWTTPWVKVQKVESMSIS